MNDGYRKAGSCVLCDKEVFTVLTRWPSDHATRANEPRRFGKPIHGAKRVTLVLAWSGNLADVTLCGDCEITPENLPILWEKIIRTHVRDRDDFYRTSIGLLPLDSRQRELMEKTHRVMAVDVPIGVLSVQDWRTIHG